MCIRDSFRDGDTFFDGDGTGLGEGDSLLAIRDPDARIVGVLVGSRQRSLNGGIVSSAAGAEDIRLTPCAAVFADAIAVSFVIHRADPDFRRIKLCLCVFIREEFSSSLALVAEMRIAILGAGRRGLRMLDQRIRCV